MGKQNPPIAVRTPPLPPRQRADPNGARRKDPNTTPRTRRLTRERLTGSADPLHVIRLANNSIDEARRRVQNDTLGHRGRKQDPLYRVRRLLISAHERLSQGVSAVSADPPNARRSTSMILCSATPRRSTTSFAASSSVEWLPEHTPNDLSECGIYPGTNLRR